jgi:hypothetical protein
VNLNIVYVYFFSVSKKAGRRGSCTKARRSCKKERRREKTQGGRKRKEAEN